VERRRVELPTSALRTHEHPDASVDSKALTSTPSDACTNACTSKPENVHDDAPDAGQDKGAGNDAADPLAKLLAAALAGLSQADRERLAAMLTGQGSDEKVTP